MGRTMVPGWGVWTVLEAFLFGLKNINRSYHEAKKFNDYTLAKQQQGQDYPECKHRVPLGSLTPPGLDTLSSPT